MHPALSPPINGLCAALLCASLLSTATAAELTVEVQGVQNNDGAVGCALFAEAAVSLQAAESRAIELRLPR